MRWSGRLVMVAMTAGGLGSAAMAAQAGGQEGPSLFAGDIGNIIWTLVIFIILVAVLGKYAWGPLLGRLQRREQLIRESLEQARRQRDEAAALLQKYSQQLDQARREAGDLIQQARRDAETARRQIVAEARNEANRMIERAQQEIALARDQAVKDLYAEAAMLATTAAEKILKRELSAGDQWNLIQESLGQLEDSKVVSR